MNKDTIVGIVGAAILVAAMVGVFKYEGARSGSMLGDEAFQVTWTTGTEAGPALSGSTEEGATTMDALDVDRNNLTAITFVLKWTDDAGAPDQFRFAVTGSDGLGHDEASGENGEIRLRFEDLNAPPQNVDVFGDGEADARERLANQYTKRLGIGAWNVTVELVDAGDETVGPTDVVVTEDTGNDWQIETEYEFYEPVLEPNADA